MNSLAIISTSLKSGNDGWRFNYRLPANLKYDHLLTFSFRAKKIDDNVDTSLAKVLHRIHSDQIRTISNHSDICIRANANRSEQIPKSFQYHLLKILCKLIRLNPIQSENSIRMNLNESEVNFQPESIQTRIYFQTEWISARIENSDPIKSEFETRIRIRLEPMYIMWGWSEDINLTECDLIRDCSKDSNPNKSALIRSTTKIIIWLNPI